MHTCRRALRSLENPLFLWPFRALIPEGGGPYERTALENLAKLHAGGVSIAAGTDAGGVPWGFPGYAMHDELERMVEAGLSPRDALHAATAGGAQLLGLERRIGRIAPGYAADVLLLRADPLADVRHTRELETVFLAGRALRPITRLGDAAR